MPNETTEVFARDEWQDDDGHVLWHRLGEWGDLCEPPFVADLAQLEDEEPWPGYFSHWSRLPSLPRFPIRELMLAPQGALICDVEI